MSAFALPACSGATKAVAEDAATRDAGDHEDASKPSADGSVPDAGDGGVMPTLIIEPDNGMMPFYNLVSSAKKSIDMTMYLLEDDTMEGLLETAQKNGVSVRVILDQNLEMKDNTAAYTALSAAGVAVHWADTVYAATHQKTITVDGTTSAVMTLNMSSYYYPTSRDFAVITTDAADVAAIETVFGADFTNAAISPPDGDNLVWSPTNAEYALETVINDAKTSLLIENEEMGDTDIISALTAAAARGVSVEVVMTNSKSWTVGFTTLTAGGVKVVTYPSDASIYIHAKVILADYGESTARVFIGSENFTESSLTRNRELGTILTDAEIMSSIDATLSSDFKGGTPF